MRGFAPQPLSYMAVGGGRKMALEQGIGLPAY
jgi:hypothetical protein